MQSRTAHSARSAFYMARCLLLVSSAELGEPITLRTADPHRPRLFTKVAERLRGALPTDLVPDIEHIGGTAVLALGAKPIVDLMVGLREPERIREMVARFGPSDGAAVARPVNPVA
jgi:GrpB-like predicted nucleotidyltransferase (UPF0157 family)